jgi:hypothetical protein
MGHHPVYPVNGFAGPLQREIHQEDGARRWELLVRHGVVAYLCSHILAFDVQVHDGVLQLLTAGAGTLHRMPEEVEYLHVVQLALDTLGLRYQVLDRDGVIRERLDWPPRFPKSSTWRPLAAGVQPVPAARVGAPLSVPVAWSVSGLTADDGGAEQTILSAWDSGPALPPLWLGLRGSENRLALLLAPAAGRSPHLWLGPSLPPGRPFTLQLALHPDMGPGGVLWRVADDAPWSSLAAASPWGPERLHWPARWSVGHDKPGPAARPFRLTALTVSWQRSVTER